MLEWIAIAVVIILVLLLGLVVGVLYEASLNRHYIKYHGYCPACNRFTDEEK